jgi:hypothetical protein
MRRVTPSQGHKVHCWSEAQTVDLARPVRGAGCTVDERFHSRYETTSAVYLLITVELFARVSAYTQLFLARIVCACAGGGSGSVFCASCADVNITSPGTTLGPRGPASVATRRQLKWVCGYIPHSLSIQGACPISLHLTAWAMAPLPPPATQMVIQPFVAIDDSATDQWCPW